MVTMLPSEPYLRGCIVLSQSQERVKVAKGSLSSVSVWGWSGAGDGPIVSFPPWG